MIPLAGVPLVLCSCASVKVAPIEVKPIHIVHDINIRVDKQLDEFFAFDQGAATRPSTQPAAATTTPTTTTASR
jgi:hypothetical protein